MFSRSIAVGISVFALLFFVWGCSPATTEPDPTPSDPAGQIFTVNPTEAHVVEAVSLNEDGSSTTRPVPNNQIMLMFAAGVPVQTAVDTLGRMQADLRGVGLSLVGQIPDLGIYQLEIVNDLADPAASIAALDAVMEQLRAYPDVATVGYNELLTDRAVENDDDNSGIVEYDRCALAVIDYYQAIPLFDRVMPHVALSDVTVAVIDSGLWLESGQFDDIRPRLQFLNDVAPSTTPYDWHLHKHGTNIAALIAADNGDGLTNGIALRVLGDRLHLMVGDAHIWGNSYSLARCLSTSRQAVLLGADIVNLSVGRGNRLGSPRWLQSAQEQFDRLFTSAPDVLFIAAASNDNMVLNGNDAPAGMPNPNLLTVGGFTSCHPDQRFFMSATGPGIEIAGPATDVPGFAGDNMFGPARLTLTGNSFAAPLVGAIAAIIKSIDPSLTGAQLKEILLDDDHTWPAHADVGGRRPAMIKTISTVLLNRAAASGTIDSILDAFGPADNISDPSGYSINRLCGEIEATITGPAHHATISLDAPRINWGPSQINYGLIGMGHQVILSMADSAGSDQVMLNTTSGFRLNEPYSERLSIVVETPDGRQSTGIDGGSGTFSFSECELTTRSLPLDWFDPARSGPHQLVFIEVTGSFSGTNQGAMRLSDGRITHGVSYSAGGTFTTAFMLLDPEADTMAYLERNCVGGYQFGADD